jgi:hypothetical protein
MICLGVVSYLLLVFIGALLYFQAGPEVSGLAAFLHEVGKANEFNLPELRLCYTAYIFLAGLPFGLYPAGFWLVNWQMEPFLFFMVSALMVSWLRSNIMFGVPWWLAFSMQVIGGFPLICLLLKHLPNSYELPMYVVASFCAMYTYHFLVIVLFGLWFQNLAKGVLEFLGLKVEHGA